MHSWVRELLSFSLLSLSAVFFVVDPMGVVPVFVAMTQRDSQEKREQMARRAALTAFLILTVFAVAGTVIFRLLGVTLGAFKVAGGILLLLRAERGDCRVYRGGRCLERIAAKRGDRVLPLLVAFLPRRLRDAQSARQSPQAADCAMLW